MLRRVLELAHMVAGEHKVKVLRLRRPLRYQQHIVITCIKATINLNSLTLAINTINPLVAVVSLLHNNYHSNPHVTILPPIMLYILLNHRE